MDCPKCGGRASSTTADAATAGAAAADAISRQHRYRESSQERLRRLGLGAARKRELAEAAAKQAEDDEKRKLEEEMRKKHHKRAELEGWYSQKQARKNLCEKHKREVERRKQEDEKERRKQETLKRLAEKARPPKRPALKEEAVFFNSSSGTGGISTSGITANIVATINSPSRGGKKPRSVSPVKEDPSLSGKVAELLSGESVSRRGDPAEAASRKLDGGIFPVFVPEEEVIDAGTANDDSLSGGKDDHHAVYGGGAGAVPDVAGAVEQSSLVERVANLVAGSESSPKMKRAPQKGLAADVSRILDDGDAAAARLDERSELPMDAGVLPRTSVDEALRNAPTSMDKLLNLDEAMRKEMLEGPGSAAAAGIAAVAELTFEATGLTALSAAKDAHASALEAGARRGAGGKRKPGVPGKIHVVPSAQSLLNSQVQSQKDPDPVKVPNFAGTGAGTPGTQHKRAQSAGMGGAPATRGRKKGARPDHTGAPASRGAPTSAAPGAGPPRIGRPRGRSATGGPTTNMVTQQAVAAARAPSLKKKKGKKHLQEPTDGSRAELEFLKVEFLALQQKYNMVALHESQVRRVVRESSMQYEYEQVVNLGMKLVDSRVHTSGEGGL